MIIIIIIIIIITKEYETWTYNPDFYHCFSQPLDLSVSA